MATLGIEFGVIKDARRRQWRRRATALGVVVVACGAGAIVYSIGEWRSAPIRSEPADVTRVSPSVMLSGSQSGAGVACRVPNSIACDRVGVAVWLRRPAVSVRATIAGRTIELDDPDWSGPSRHGTRRWFAGFLQDAGLTRSGPLEVKIDKAPDYWAGAHPKEILIRLLATYRDGTKQTTTIRTYLAPGWG